MKMSKIFAVMGGILIAFWLSGNALAFHEGGVAHCDGCHSMHNSVNGLPDEDVKGGTVGEGINANLTKGTDPSSTCLNCHAGTGGFHIASDVCPQDDPMCTNEVSYSAGGDFVWLQHDYSWTRHNEPGDGFGHNIIAIDYGYTEDTQMQTSFSPGGSYPKAALGCTSCHDPHGKVAGGGVRSASGSYGDPDPTDGSILGNYRLLGDSSYVAPATYNVPSNTSGYAFTNNAPIATARNMSGGPYGYRVDYGSGMSEWCGNCHTNFVADGSTAHVHPASNNAHLLPQFVNNYNNYVATGDMSGSRGYDPVVPFERGITDRTQLDPDNPGLATTSSNVMCLTCHRAHASGFTNMTRWDMTSELLVESHPTTGDGGYFLPYPYGGYYVDGANFDPGQRYNENQRSLCNKCHAQDS